jgi:hypothetical protein
MRDGTIGLDKAKGIVGWAIKRISGKAWGHSKQYIAGFTWERTIWWVGYWFKSGIKVTVGYVMSDCYGQPKIKRTPAQINAMLCYYIEELNKRRPYNIAKLLVLAFVIPHKKFFQRIGWVPFENAELGDVCSPTTDEACKRAAWDVLPARDEEYTAPGDFLDSTEFAWTTERPE